MSQRQVQTAVIDLAHSSNISISLNKTDTRPFLHTSALVSTEFYSLGYPVPAVQCLSRRKQITGHRKTKFR